MNPNNMWITEKAFVDFDRMEVRFSDGRTKSFPGVNVGKLLLYLAENKTKNLFSADELIQGIWGKGNSAYGYSNINLNTEIKKLRDFLGCEKGELLFYDRAVKIYRFNPQHKQLKREYGKRRLSDNEKKQISKICASIITAMVGVGNLPVLAGIETAGDSIYELWKTKPNKYFRQRLVSQIERAENPEPDIINYDMIQSVLIAAVRKIKEKSDRKDLLVYKNEYALFNDIFGDEAEYKDINALKAGVYYRNLLSGISNLISCLNWQYTNGLAYKIFVMDMLKKEALRL